MTARSAVLLVAAAWLSACAGHPSAARDHFGLPIERPILHSDVAAHREARLAYPGSQMVRLVGSDQTAQSRGDEPDPAYSGAVYTVAATPSQLYRWYAAWLLRHHYRPVTYYRQTDQPSGVAWQVSAGPEQVQIAVFDPRLLTASTRITAWAPAHGLIYEEVLVAYPA